MRWPLIVCYNKRAHALCIKYIVTNVIGNINNRRTRFGLELHDYFMKLKEVDGNIKGTVNVSSDIIEPIFGI